MEAIKKFLEKHASSHGLEFVEAANYRGLREHGIIGFEARLGYGDTAPTGRGFFKARDRAN